MTFRGIQLETGETATAYEAYKGLVGQESVKITACGKNLFDMSTLAPSHAGTAVETGENSVHVSTTGSGGVYRGANSEPFWIRKGVPYALSATLAEYGSGNARVGLRGADDDTFLDGAYVIFAAATGRLTAAFTPTSDEFVYLSALCTNGTTLTGDCTFADIQLEAGNAATDYEPYHDMGGGTVVPSEPLYGLPVARDTVSVAVDGDVLVTRRTGVVVLDGTETWGAYATAVSVEMRFRLDPGATPGIQPPPDNDTAANLLCSHYLSVPATTGGTYECVAGISVHASEKAVYIYDEQYSDGNVEAWKSYLAAQYAAGTPVTIVYELAAPETEALTAVTAITPAKGPVSIITDADALSASIVGSGWETVNDTADVREGMRVLQTTVTQQAEGLEVAVSEAKALDGRLSTLEFGVRVGIDGVELGASDSEYTTFLDEDSFDIRQSGQTIASFAFNKMWTQAAEAQDYLKVGNYIIRKSGDGGLAFSL